MEVDEKYVDTDIALGVDKESLHKLLNEISHDKTLDCPSKILKRIMTLDIPDNTKAYMCFRLGSADAQYTFMKALRHAEFIPIDLSSLQKDDDESKDRFKKSRKGGFRDVKDMR